MKFSSIQVLTLTALLLILPASVWAQPRPHAVFFSPFVGGYVFEGNQQLETGPMVGLGLGYNFTHNWAAEVVGFYVATEGDDGSRGPDDLAAPGEDVDLWAGKIDVLYNFFPDMKSLKPGSGMGTHLQKLVPYVAAGGGISSTDPDDASESDEDLLANYGAGFNYYFNQDLALRGDIRHVLNIDADDDEREDDLNHNFSFYVGLTCQFGPTK